MKRLSCYLLFLLAGAMFSCQSSPPPAEEGLTRSGLRFADFEKEINGRPVKLFQLVNKNGMEATATNYGARLVSLLVPGRDGKPEDVVQGFSSIDGYLNAKGKSFGATIGRYANRIAGGRFVLQGDTIRLAQNDGENHLHGGPGGLRQVVWEGRQLDSQRVELRYRSPDGEEGYPGTLYLTVDYELTDDNALRITHRASTDKETVVNLANHSFFNLSGDPGSPIGSHILMIAAGRFTPVGEGLIPTGELAPVEGTPLDFRAGKPIGQDIGADNEQLLFGRGYDHNFVLDMDVKSPEGLAFAARVTEPNSGRILEVWTNEPGLQFYSGNFLDGSDTGKEGISYGHRTAFCLETQHFPDSPNQPQFPSTILQPGRVYHSVCEYRFSVDK